MICPSYGHHTSDAQSICTGCGESLHSQRESFYSLTERLRLYPTSGTLRGLTGRLNRFTGQPGTTMP